MAQRHEVTITLSDEAIAFVKAKLATGEYASESDVIEHELESARLEDEERRRWEREELIPVLDELERNPSATLTADQVREHLRAAREERLKAS